MVTATSNWLPACSWTDLAWGYNIFPCKQDDQAVDIHGNEFNIHVYNSKRNIKFIAININSMSCLVQLFVLFAGSSFPPQHALPLGSNTVNQLWFSTVQLACCKTFAICYIISPG